MAKNDSGTVYTTTIEVVKMDGMWRVIRHFNVGHEKELTQTTRKAFAVWYARGFGRAAGEAALMFERGVEVIIKDRKGVIREKNTFGYDPKYSRG